MATITKPLPGPQDTLRRVDEDGVEFIRLWFTDILGQLKSFAIGREELEGALAEGMGFDGSSITGFNRIEESDMIAMPDPDTYAMLPWRIDGHKGNVARMFCDILRPGGERGEVEVAALVEDRRHPGLAQLVAGEVEVLQLRADVVGVEPQLLGAGQRPAHDEARIALIGLAAGPQDVAEHPRDVALVTVDPPREHRVRVSVGHRDHVRLLDSVEAGDRRAVEAHALCERPLQLLATDREALQLSEYVGEPEANELHAVVLCLADDVLGARGPLRDRCHVRSLLQSWSSTRSPRVRDASRPYIAPR
jgi:hypothetical protein